MTLDWFGSSGDNEFADYKDLIKKEKRTKRKIPFKALLEKYNFTKLPDFLLLLFLFIQHVVSTPFQYLLSISIYCTGKIIDIGSKQFSCSQFRSLSWQR